MIISNGENYTAKLIAREENSAFVYLDLPISFRCKIANNLQRKTYRIMKGVEGTEDTIYLIASNLPVDIKDGDKIEFLGKIMSVQSIGYYLIESGIINGGVMNNDYLIKRCPKGITLA